MKGLAQIGIDLAIAMSTILGAIKSMLHNAFRRVDGMRWCNVLGRRDPLASKSRRIEKNDLHPQPEMKVSCRTISPFQPPTGSVTYLDYHPPRFFFPGRLHTPFAARESAYSDAAPVKTQGVVSSDLAGNSDSMTPVQDLDVS